MKGKSRLSTFLFLAFLIPLLLTGCVRVISRQLREQADKSLTVSVVQKDPDAYKGKIVFWSGRIIGAENLKSDDTLFEVLQQPAGFGGRPQSVDYSEGRFMVINHGYLDTAIYKKGRDVTVAGEVEGKRIKPVGEVEYTYPLVVAKEIYLWPEETRYAPYSPYYYPYYPYPYGPQYWWPDPYWYPWHPRWP